MKPLESFDLTPTNQNLLTEYEANITQALQNIRGVINLLEQADAQLDQKVALAQDIINSTLDQFQNLDQKMGRILAENHLGKRQ